MNHNQLKLLTALHQTPLMVTDCDDIRKKYKELSKALPGVKLHYAIKPFPHENVLRTLYWEGASFDVATTGEIKILQKANIQADRCIHTHPIKKDQDIKDAIRYGITSFVVDNENEILKFVRYKKKVNLMLRVAFSSPTASIDLSKKFGCEAQTALNLIEFARKHGVRINGLVFHVGSQSRTSDMYVEAINTCIDLMAEVILKGFSPIEILDIGGGFPVSYDCDEQINIDEFCKPIRESLNRVPAHVKIYAEPGRFIVGTSTFSIATIIGKKFHQGKFHYYIDDGIYDTYSLQFFDSVVPTISHTGTGSDLHPTIIWGITCDSTDIIRQNIEWPELQIGDFIMAHNMGAYSSISTGTNFNLVNRAKYIFLNR